MSRMSAVFSAIFGYAISEVFDVIFRFKIFYYLWVRVCCIVYAAQRSPGGQEEKPRLRV